LQWTSYQKQEEEWLFKYLKALWETHQYRNIYSVKLSFKSKGEIKTCSLKEKNGRNSSPADPYCRNIERNAPIQVWWYLSAISAP
jgi:hypothetical protein